MTPRRWLGACFWALVSAAACSATPRSGGNQGQIPCEECEASADTPDRSSDSPGLSGPPPAGVSDLCRTTTACDLDSVEACVPVAEPAGAGGAGGGAAGGGFAGGGAAGGGFAGGGAAGGGFSGGAGDGQSGGQGGAAGEGAAGDGGRVGPAAGAAGVGAGGEAGAGPFACRKVRSGTNGIVKCAPAGTLGHGDTCTSSSQCAAGFSCAAQNANGGGVCLRSCCSVNSCDEVTSEKTYCAVIQLFEGETPGSSASRLDVPVCLPAKTCNVLLPAGGGVCKEGEICRLVDGRGTASCEPAPVNSLGVSDDPCPCSEGYACLRQSDTCRKLCPLGSDEACGPGGMCLSGGQAFPEGVGVCGPGSAVP